MTDTSLAFSHCVVSCSNLPFSLYWPLCLSLDLSHCSHPLFIPVTPLSPFFFSLMSSCCPLIVFSFLYSFPHPLPLYSPSLCFSFLFLPPLYCLSTHPFSSSLLHEPATTGHILVGLIGYDNSDKRLWDSITLPGPWGPEVIHLEHDLHKGRRSS